MTEIYVSVSRGHRATVAKAAAMCKDGTVLDATGEALRHPTDKADNRVGDDLAVARAVEALGRKMERRANGQVKCNDDNRRHSERAARKRQAFLKKGSAHSENGVKKITPAYVGV